MQPEFVPNLGQLEDSWLADAEFSRNDAFDFEVHAAVWSLDVKSREVVVDEGATSLHVTVQVRWDAVEDRPFEEPFNATVTVGGRFGWSNEVDDEYRRGWTEFNGLYLLWPYARSYISMLTGAAGLPPFHLPTLAVPRGKMRAAGETTEFQAIQPADSAGPPAG